MNAIGKMKENQKRNRKRIEYKEFDRKVLEAEMSATQNSKSKSTFFNKPRS